MVGVSVRAWIGPSFDGEGILSGIRVYADSTLNAVGTPPMCEYFLGHSARVLISVKKYASAELQFFPSRPTFPGCGVELVMVMRRVWGQILLPVSHSSARS